MDTDTPPEAIALADEVYAFLQYMKLERCASPNTLDSYDRDLKRFAAWVRATGESYLTPTRKGMLDFLERLRASGLADSSRRRVVSALKSFVNYLHMSGRPVNESIADLSVPARWNRLPQVLTPEEVARLLDAPRQSRGSNWRRDTALLAFLDATAVRVSEACDARLCDLNLNNQTCLITGKGNKQRIVPFTSTCREALENYLKLERPTRAGFYAEAPQLSPPMVFLSYRSKALNRTMVWLIIQKYARQAGLRQVHPHMLRHTCATHLLQNGMDLLLISEMLGHSKLSSTQRYTECDAGQMHKIHSQYHPRGGKPSEANAESEATPPNLPPVPTLAPAAMLLPLPLERWEAMIALLPVLDDKNSCKLPYHVMATILAFLRTGKSWSRSSGNPHCCSETARNTFVQWTEEGVFQKLWDAKLMTPEEWDGVIVRLARSRVGLPSSRSPQMRRAA